jgi:histone-lysine N-methyltransferase SETD2
VGAGTDPSHPASYHRYVKREPRLGLFASMQIAEGEELSYNYAMKWSGDANVAQRCYCESPNCTGYLGKPPNGSSTR